MWKAGQLSTEHDNRLGKTIPSTADNPNGFCYLSDTAATPTLDEQPQENAKSVVAHLPGYSNTKLPPTPGPMPKMISPIFTMPRLENVTPTLMTPQTKTINQFTQPPPPTSKIADFAEDSHHQFQDSSVYNNPQSIPSTSVAMNKTALNDGINKLLDVSQASHTPIGLPSGTSAFRPIAQRPLPRLSKVSMSTLHKVNRNTMNLPMTTASPTPKKCRLSDDFSNSDENMKRLAAAMDRRFDELGTK